MRTPTKEKIDREIKNTNNNKIYLQNVGIGNEECKYLANKLKDNNTITSLDLSLNNIAPEGAQSLSECLKHNNTITSLDLIDNNIGDKGAQSLSECLKYNNTITSLDLSYNNIGDKGAQSLSECLKHNSTITSLDLIVNNIGDKGAQSLSECLKYNNTITSLDLIGNNIGSEGAQSLSECLKHNNTITSLNLMMNNIPNDLIRYIKSLLENNRRIYKFGGSKIKRSKMIVLGDGGVGKTCLVQSLKGLPFQEQRSTEVLSLETLTLKQNESNETIQVELTDFGGQDIYRCFHSLMMSNSCVYVLVFRALDFHNQKLNWWIDSLKNIVDLSSNGIIVVFTHCDDYSPIISHDHPDVDAFFQVDNKSKNGISELKNGLIDQFYQENVERITFSNQHQKVIDTIHNHNSDLKIDIYLFYCWAQESGFEDIQSIHSLLNLLHGMNIVFHFDNIREIEHIIWINPHRFLEGLRCVLNSDPKRSQYFDQGILWNNNINNAFQHFIKHQQQQQKHQKQDNEGISSIISGLLKLLQEMNMLFPIKSKEPPFKTEGYIIPSRLPNNDTAPSQSIYRDSLNANKIMIRTVQIPNLFMSGIFSRLMSKLWKYMIPDSYSSTRFCLEYNKTKSIIINDETKSDNISIVVFGKYPLKLLSKIYHSVVELMKQMGMNDQQIHNKMEAICPTCYQKQSTKMTAWSKESITRRLLKNKSEFECVECDESIPIVNLLFSEEILYVVYNFGSLLLDNNNLSYENNYFIQIGKEMNVGGELYPIYDSTTQRDQQKIQQHQNSLGMNDWSFLERLGKSSRIPGKFYGGQSAVFLCKSKKENLEQPDQFYAVKALYNYGLQGKRQVLDHFESEYSIMQQIEVKRTFARQVCHFTDHLDKQVLPNLDASAVEDGALTLFIANDAHDGIMKHYWPNNDMSKTSFRIVGGYILQILHCLKDLQKQKLVHRDIKWDNFLYCSEYDCFLLADFGEAIQTVSNDMKLFLAKGSQSWGNPETKPPEVATGITIDYSKSDLFGAGIMLLKLMSMRREKDPLDLNIQSDDQHEQVIEEHIGNETKEQQILGSLIYQMIRTDIENRFSVQNAIDAISYLLWGQNVDENNLGKWKKDKIYEIGIERLKVQKMRMNDILELEYVSSVTIDKIHHGKEISSIMMNYSNIQQHLSNEQSTENNDQDENENEEIIECEECECEPPLNATKYCEDEETYLCDDCCSMKHRGKKSKNHRITLLTN